MIDALPLLLGPEGYQISRSVRLRSSASAYFNRTMAAGSAVTVYTFSAWVKRGELGTIKPIVQGYLNNNNYGHIIFKADNTIEWREFSVAVNYGQVNTNAVFRDPSAWYHIVVVRNGTSLLIYVNGVSQTLTVSTAVNAAGGYLFGASTEQRIGRDQVNSAFFDGYLTECYLIDGQALTPASFGETDAVTGVWQPKKYAGTYGTNGFYLNFSDNSAATAAAIGADYSGNGNDWTPNNISVTAGVTYDSMLDVPTLWADGGNGRGNYATLNPVDKHANSAISNGNLTTVITSGGSSPRPLQRSTIFASSGKWYWEVTLSAGSTISGFGVANNAALISDALGYNANGWGWYGHSGGPSLYHNNVGTSYGTAWSVGDVGMVALDMDTGRIWFGRNGTWFASSDPATNTSPAYSNVTGSVTPTVSDYGSGSTETFNINFGQRPFAYTPPTGFKALNTLNLPTPTILKGNQYFDINLWTGNGTSQTIVNSGGFAPDLVWFKSRSSGALWNVLCDTVRGATKELYSNATNAETTDVTDLTSFNSNGFSVGSGNGANQNAGTYVGWQWKEGATQGFDIVTYTGTGVARTVAHSLGVAPSMMIVKRRNTTSDWIVWHSAFAGTEYIALNSTAAKATGATIWNSTSPTSSVFSVGTSGATNGNTDTYVAYLFAEVAGFSKFGAYTGNGSSDGPFVFCGFRPRYVMLKASSTTEIWIVYDSSRNTYNVADLYLYPNSSAAEAGSGTPRIDFLSNGFKLRNTGQGNVSAVTYIFAAFAESPFKNALAR